MDAAIPVLSEAFIPPIVLGTADLTDFAYQGNDYAALMSRIRGASGRNPPADEEAAWTYDAGIAAQLRFRRAEGLNLQDAALATSQVFRVATGGTEPASASSSRSRQGDATTRRPTRMLALAGPGDLMTNTPLDFLTNHLNIRLDLVYVVPGRPLPPVLPDHDVAFFAVGEADPATLARLRWLYAVWPRPALNNPVFLPALERDTLSRSLAGVPNLCSPTAVRVSRADLEAEQPTEGFDPRFGPFPCLIRPVGSHAGANLSRTQTRAELTEYLRFSVGCAFFVTAFEDYASPDGLYRKSRVAFIDRQPFLCHLAISSDWMVHYLNAGMTESAAKRAEEARTMAGFDSGFARRHAAAFEALHQRIGFDFYSIDCAETKDGRLLVFEADAGAIIHLMDPADLFPYKQPQMRKVFAAFEAMVRRRCDQRRA
jgi:hypothetical protein